MLGQAFHPYFAGGTERQPPIVAWRSEVTHAMACSVSVGCHQRRAAGTVASVNLTVPSDSGSAVCERPVD